ncbi:helix-turn-helix domain-containing protein [Dysgonomonas macrotermitis]|uniref:Regulatory protein, luxR family n=1 Tax=Dysgonomonas macrotermitis TaxID=1346286 RepID=A0A1M5IYW9_9BACT|nr:response regulator transcription factor [Dysgonomonas macrotermitis]SHG33502.1 hypothetical protein SAMN05444362_12162 [Dysgonomonas macrotermitis]
MDRVFTELTERVDFVSQQYATGMEKQEIADKNFKALCTVNNQIMKAFEVLGIRNRSELSILYAKRIAIKRARIYIARKVNLHEFKQGVMALILLFTMSYDIYINMTDVYQMNTRFSIEKQAKRSRRSDLEIEPLIV